MENDINIIVTSKELDFAEKRSVRVNNRRPILVQNCINFNMVSNVSSGISTRNFKSFTSIYQGL